MTTNPAGDALRSYLAGTASPEETRTKLRRALREGDGFSVDLTLYPPERQQEIADLFRGALDDEVNRVGMPPRRRWPAPGQALFATLLFWSGLKGVEFLVLAVKAPDLLGFGPRPWIVGALAALKFAAALAASWSVWWNTQSVLRLYLLWVTTALAFEAYLAIAGFSQLGPEPFRAMARNGLVVSLSAAALVCVAGYAYLRWRLPKRPPA